MPFPAPASGLIRGLALPFTLLIPPLTSARQGLRRLLALRELQRQRRHLAQLDARLLEDIGLTRSEAREETGRAFWDAPPHWYQ